MLRPVIILSIVIFLVSCKSDSQGKTNTPESAKLFKEGAELLKQGIKLEFSDSIGGLKYYRQAIEKITAAYNADTTNIELGTYFSDLYFKTRQYDSALVWALRMLPFDSVTYYRSDSTLISERYGFIGSCYLYEGDIINGEKYFRLALSANKHQTISLAQTLSGIADEFYFSTLPNQIEKLKRKNIAPCKYSIDIMRLGLSIGETDKFVKDVLFSNEKFNERKKKC